MNENIIPLCDNMIGDRQLISSKGWGLAQILKLGIPTPAGFIITSNVFKTFIKDEKFFINALLDEVMFHVNSLEQKTQREFGGNRYPLLLSIRSGSNYSMPGILETWLNIGLTNTTFPGLFSEGKLFAIDTFKRLFLNYIGHKHISSLKPNIFSYNNNLLKIFPVTYYNKMVSDIKNAIGDDEFLYSPRFQLECSIKSVYMSFFSEKSKKYQEINNIDLDQKMSIIIQSMVFGNKNYHSGTGVLFTSNPHTGVDEFIGDFLQGSQGPDVVSGKNNPQGLEFIRKTMPKAYKELIEYSKTIHNYLGTSQHIEFTIEDEKVFILQTRPIFREDIEIR